jgi:hypothetical protein
MAIARAPYIQLEAEGEFQAGRVGRQRVFRRMPQEPAMRRQARHERFLRSRAGQRPQRHGEQQGKASKE